MKLTAHSPTPDDRSRKPKIRIESVLGRIRISMTDGECTVCLGISKDGIRHLVGKLNAVLEMAEDEE